jgi:hypothetical protein
MPPEFVVPLAAFVVGYLLRLVIGGRATERTGAEAAARRFIDARIEEHIDRLAAKHRRAATERFSDPDDVPPAFANDIQSFIAEALLRDVVVATGDEEVAGAVRELVVLERGYIYARVMKRIQELSSRG